MGKITIPLFVMGCVFSMIPVFFAPTWLWGSLTVLGYGVFGLLFWNDRSHQREVTWVMYALMVFSAVMGLDFWHRVFRVGFWMALLFSEVSAETRERGVFLGIGAFFVWGVSLVFSVSSWQWWVGGVDALGWLCMAGFFLLEERLAVRE
ncbi:MAG: hypothetical protein N2314_00425 [Brevinematales bacterium]|nr:hypothetical protein [Brevinematales bacterium]